MLRKEDALLICFAAAKVHINSCGMFRHPITRLKGTCQETTETQPPWLYTATFESNLYGINKEIQPLRFQTIKQDQDSIVDSEQENMYFPFLAQAKT
jgi:hypothetical protein